MFMKCSEGRLDFVRNFINLSCYIQGVNATGLNLRNFWSLECKAHFSMFCSKWWNVFFCSFGSLSYIGYFIHNQIKEFDHNYWVLFLCFYSVFFFEFVLFGVPQFVWQVYIDHVLCCLSVLEIKEGIKWYLSLSS